jgi:hypothetical protein
MYYSNNAKGFYGLFLFVIVSSEYHPYSIVPLQEGKVLELLPCTKRLIEECLTTILFLTSHFQKKPA